MDSNFDSQAGNSLFWHLYTDGANMPNIFNTDDQFKEGMTALALGFTDAVQKGLEVHIYAFALMNNHIHELVSGSAEDCLELFKFQKKRLSRFVSERISLVNLKGEISQVPDINSLQNEICYIHRNGYVVNSSETPYSYKWSTAPYYFNPISCQVSAQDFNQLPFKDRRRITKAAISSVYNTFKVTEDYISPLSFCSINQGETFFKSAHQYFYKLSKNFEAYSLIAQKLSDEVFMSDEDIYAVLQSKTKSLFGLVSHRLLNPDQRLKIAKILRSEYRATQPQLKRLLNLPTYLLQELFPKAK